MSCLIVSFFLFFHGSITTYATPSGLMGHYAAISDLSSPETIEARIKDLGSLGAREFQFYDVVPSYTPPVLPSNPQSLSPQWRKLVDSTVNRSICWAGESWLPNYARQRIRCRTALDTALSAIKKLGGRAWLYAQIIGADSNSLSYTPLKDETSSPACLPTCNNSNRLFYCYKPTPSFAHYQASLYGPLAKELGFDGIHWDTLGLGACGSKDADELILSGGYGDYLSISKALLGSLSLAQTMNWVSASGFRSEQVTLVEFPYVECWDAKCRDSFFQKGGAGAVGSSAVIAYYPCENMTFLTEMFLYSASMNSSYLVLADGLYYLSNEYFPNAIHNPLPTPTINILLAQTNKCGVPGLPCSCHSCTIPDSTGNCHNWGC